jgi:lysozyme family protein
MAGNFDRCLNVVLRLEGGASNHPADHGGATNHGVTQRIYDHYRELLELPQLPVTAITMTEVEALYQRLYWKPSSAEHLDWPLDLLMFDAFVQHQPAVARQMLQAAMAWDGPVADEARAFLSVRLFQYQRIAAVNPTQAVFLPGWTNRIERLKREAGV